MSSMANSILGTFLPQRTTNDYSRLWSHLPYHEIRVPAPDMPLYISTASSQRSMILMVNWTLVTFPWLRVDQQIESRLSPHSFRIVLDAQLLVYLPTNWSPIAGSWLTSSMGMSTHIAFHTQRATNHDSWLSSRIPPECVPVSASAVTADRSTISHKPSQNPPQGKVNSCRVTSKDS